MHGMTLTKVGETDLRVTRRFTAPPHAIYHAHLDPALVQQWMLGPEGWTMPVCKIDARPGGRFSYTWENGEGHRFTIAGSFETLDPPHLICHSEEMEMGPGELAVSQVETRFSPDGDGTLMTMTIRYTSGEAREGALASGMEHGMAATYDRLDATVPA